MMRSLFTGVTGLRSHQTRMDVIGNNISNVNTIGFKGSRVTFRDVLYQNIAFAGMPSPLPDMDGPLRGGTNPTQIGSGVMVSHIDVLNTRAAPMTTDRPMDVYLDGEGYFAVFNQGSGNVYFTRVGDLRFDTLGNLVDGNGNFVLGLRLDRPFPIGEELPEDLDPDSPGMIVPGSVDSEEWSMWLEEATNWESPDNAMVNINFIEEFEGGLFTTGRITQISIGPDGTIMGFVNSPDEEGEGELMILGRIYTFSFPNPEGLQQVGNTYLLPSANSGFPAVVIPGTNGTGRTITSRLEMSNVELAREFTDMIITQRGFQANSRIISVSDEMLQELVNLRR